MGTELHNSVSINIAENQKVKTGVYDKIRDNGKSRNDLLDVIKLIASYFVVSIHVPFYGDFRDIVVSVARFAVPLFFAVSGFFAYQNDIYKLKKKMKNILSLFIFSAVLYHVRDVIWSVKDNGLSQGIADYFAQFADVKQWLNLIFFNDVFTCTHLWFLLALLYVYVVIYLVQKLKIGEKVLFVSAISILSAHLLLRYSSLIFGFQIEDIYFRNFFFTGYPFFVLGMMQNKYESKLKSIHVAVLVAALAVGVAEPIITSTLLGPSEMYIGSVLASMALIILALKYSHAHVNKTVVAIAQSSTYIYVFHNIVYNVLNMILPMIFNIDTSSAAYINFMPIFICVVTTIFSLCYMKFKSKILKKNKG